MCRIAATAAAVLAALVGGLSFFQRWQRRWGAAKVEVDREMPGDELVADPDYLTTRAITVDARPEDIYPWLVQMGYRRGGLYSYDWLDRTFGFLDGPSATEIVPELQHLDVGDVIPIGKGAGFPVRILDPERAFVLGDPDAGWSWQTCFYPMDGEHTRLVTRNRARMKGLWGSPLFRFGMDLAAFIMVRRWLIVLKGRAEKLARQRRMLAEAGLPAWPDAEQAEQPATTS
jgi:hypothetical protein